MKEHHPHLQGSVGGRLQDLVRTGALAIGGAQGEVRVGEGVVMRKRWAGDRGPDDPGEVTNHG